MRQDFKDLKKLNVLQLHRNTPQVTVKIRNISCIIQIKQ